MKNSTYSNALAVASEKYFLGNERINRMTGATPEEALGILAEVDFGGGVSIKSPFEFELLIRAEENKLFDFIKEYCTSEAFTEFFITGNDFYNAQAYLRAKYLKFDPEPMLMAEGLIKCAELKEKILVDEYDGFGKELKEALLAADRMFVEHTATGSKIDELFKSALYKRLYVVSKKDSDLKNLYGLKADEINVSLALRKPYEEAEKSFVPGGSFDKSELKAISMGTIDISSVKKNKEKAETLSLAFRAKEENRALSEFEKHSDDLIMEYLLKKKYSSEKIYPFMLYCYYKKRELENVRIVMVGLLNGMSEADIKGRLRKSYEW